MSMIAFYTGASGMRAFQEKLNVVSHNIANVNTNGYKARRAAFEDLLYSRINTNVEGEHLVGHGVKQENIDQIMTQGGLDLTGHPLDFAITGDGFFCVEKDGEREYTRNGAFTISMEGNVPTLATNDGAYVLDKGGNRITIGKDATGAYDTSAIREKLAVYQFDNQWGLEARNGSRFVPSENSGEPRLLAQTTGTIATGAKTEVLQGYLEFSGVDLGNEMIEMIMAQRAFQINSRVLQTADAVADELNNLR